MQLLIGSCQALQVEVIWMLRKARWDHIFSPLLAQHECGTREMRVEAGLGRVFISIKAAFKACYRVKPSRIPLFPNKVN